MKNKSKVVIIINIIISSIIFVKALDIDIDQYMSFKNVNQEVIFGIAIIGVFFIKFLILEKIVKCLEKIKKVKEYNKELCSAIMLIIFFGKSHNDMTINKVLITTIVLEMIMTVLFAVNVIKTKRDNIKVDDKI